MNLPTMRDPFPVNVPFKTEVDLYKVGRPLRGQMEEKLFMIDQQFEMVINEKLDVIQAFPDHSVVYLDDDIDDLQVCLWQLAERIAIELPDYAACDETSFTSKLLGLSLSRNGQLMFQPELAAFPELAERCYSHLQAQAPFERLCNMLAVSIEEDIVIMRNTGGGDHTDQGECFIVAMPTHWDPAKQVGLNFSEIHIPVGDNEPLKRSHAGLMKAMINKGPFIRYNWALTSSPALSQNPVLLESHSLEMQNVQGVDNDTLLDRLYFRSERQTMLNFPQLQRGLFALHIYQRPLKEALMSPERIEQLANSVASMTPATLEYRAMDGFADQLVEALHEYRTRAF